LQRDKKLANANNKDSFLYILKTQFKLNKIRWCGRKEQESYWKIFKGMVMLLAKCCGRSKCTPLRDHIFEAF